MLCTVYMGISVNAIGKKFAIRTPFVYFWDLSSEKVISIRMDTEIELKFLVPETELPAIPGLITQFAKTVTNKPSRNLQNAYFDTPSRELRALDIGLRTRCCDDNCEQTIKLAGEVVGGLHQRPEYNLPLNSRRPDLNAFDPSIWPHGMQLDSVAENLYPIFSTNFIRRTWLIETQSGAEIEVVLDKGEIAASNRVEAICELEIELLSGSRSELFALADMLIERLPLRLGLYSKAARGYRLADEQPLTANYDIGVVPVEKHSSQEQALMRCLNYGIAFVQKHEQCYFDKPALKTLKRITDGVSLIRHAFWLFHEIVDKRATEHLRRELKWLLKELAWVETAIQLKTFTSRKHAYYKKISNAQELTQVIDELKGLQPSIESVQGIFYSTRYNRLILDLTLWLVEKRWRASWGQQQMQAAEKPVREIAASLFEKDWQEIRQLLPSTGPVSAQTYLASRQKLERNLLSGSCLGALFDDETRQDFRTPWYDIIHGLFELSTLDYLKALCEEQGEELDDIRNWLEQKTEYLVAAMEQSREASLSVAPYWRQ